MSNPKMPKSKQLFSPEDLFAQALRDNEREFSPAEMRLLTSGLSALREHRQKHITKPELQSIKALIAYAAHTQETTVEMVDAIVTTHFEVKHVQDLPSFRYQEIVEFLVDMEVDKLLN